MTIDEVIAHAREVAEIQKNNDKLNKTLGKSSPYYNTDCIKCAEEHEQIAEWLEELTLLRLDSCMLHMPERLQLVENGYNKALADVESEFLKCDKVHYNLQDILRVLNKLKGEVAE